MNGKKENVHELITDNIENAVQSIEVARDRVSEAFLQINFAGPVDLLPPLHDIEDRLQTIIYNIHAIRKSLISEVDKKNLNEAYRRRAFDWALIDARHATNRVNELLQRAISTTVCNDTIPSDKAIAVLDVQKMANRFDQEIVKAINKIISS